MVRVPAPVRRAALESPGTVVERDGLLAVVWELDEFDPANAGEPIWAAVGIYQDQYAAQITRLRESDVSFGRLQQGRSVETFATPEEAREWLAGQVDLDEHPENTI